MVYWRVFIAALKRASLTRRASGCVYVQSGVQLQQAGACVSEIGAAQLHGNWPQRARFHRTADMATAMPGRGLRMCLSMVILNADSREKQENSSAALKGFRVSDFGCYINCPLSGMLLTDQGADVISISCPGHLQG